MSLIYDLRAKLKEEDLRVKNEFLNDVGIENLKENQKVETRYLIEHGEPNKKMTEIEYYELATCDNLEHVYNIVTKSLKNLEWTCNRKYYNDTILPCVVIRCDYKIIDTTTDELLADSDGRDSYYFNYFEVEPYYMFDAEEVKEEIIDSIDTNFIMLSDFEEKLRKIFDHYKDIGDFNQDVFNTSGKNIQDITILIDKAIKTLKDFCNYEPCTYNYVLTKDYIQMFDKVVGAMFDEFEKKQLVVLNIWEK